MANYALTRYTVQGETLDEVVALLEVNLETKDTAKLLRMYSVTLEGHTWHGFIVYDT